MFPDPRLKGYLQCRNSRSLIGAPMFAALLLAGLFVESACGVTWHEQSKVVPSDGGSGDSFGLAVSLEGDVALIGALFDDDLGTDSGSAFVYRYDGERWTLQARLTASDGTAGDLFGHFVSISENTALIGAHGNDDAGSQSGSAYVFRYDGATWIEEAKLLPSDGAATDLFGYAGSVSGERLLVGALGDAVGGVSCASSRIPRRAP